MSKSPKISCEKLLDITKEPQQPYSMKKSVTIYASPYSDRNKHMARWKAKAERLFRHGQDRESKNEFHRLREAGYLYLQRIFVDTNSKMQPIIGMFQGVLEPSIQLDLEFADEEEWLAKALIVKQRMIDFGRVFDQSNVHMVSFGVQCPEGFAYGEPIPQAADTTYQKKLHFTLKDGEKTTLGNYAKIYAIAEIVGITNLTLDTEFGQLLLYSTTEEDQNKFDQQCSALRMELSKREMIFTENTTEDVTLINYGEEQYGAVYSYDAAEAYLNGLTEGMGLKTERASEGTQD